MAPTFRRGWKSSGLASTSGRNGTALRTSCRPSSCLPSGGPTLPTRHDARKRRYEMTTDALGEWDIESEAYYAATDFISNSMMGDFRKAPGLFHRLYVEKSQAPDPPTPAMLEGSLLHCMA